MVFLLPLGLAVVGTGYFIFFTEEAAKWKLLAFGLTGLSLALQLMPGRVHYVVPLLIQTAVAIWMVIYWKMDA